jgi:outer membrane scaffolding protein for murein synthesis (MipA/OmpV family)
MRLHFAPLLIPGLLLGQEPTAAAPHDPQASPTAQRVPPAFSVTLGAGVFYGPKYLGSDQDRVLPIPILGVSYRNRVFLGASPSGVGAGLGVNLIQAGGLTVMAGLGGSEPRPEDRADALAGMDDRRLGFAAISGVSYRYGPLNAGLSLSAGLRDNAGLSGTGNLGLTLPALPRTFLTLGGSLTVADRDAMAFDFGISALEASRRSALIAAGDSRLRPGDGTPYRPEGGVRDVSANASLAYLLSPRWSLFGFGSVTRLSDAAARSSLVRRRTGWSTGAGFTVGL